MISLTVGFFVVRCLDSSCVLWSFFFLLFVTRSLPQPPPPKWGFYLFPQSPSSVCAFSISRLHTTAYFGVGFDTFLCTSDLGFPPPFNMRSSFPASPCVATRCTFTPQLPFWHRLTKGFDQNERKPPACRPHCPQSQAACFFLSVFLLGGCTHELFCTCCSA